MGSFAPYGLLGSWLEFQGLTPLAIDSRRFAAETNTTRVVLERLGVKESSPEQGQVAFLFFG
jgi:hypothetical protein